MRKRDWFIVGLVAGLIYSLFRFPAALGCLTLIILIAGIWLLYAYPIQTVLGVGGLIALVMWSKEHSK